MNSDEWININTTDTKEGLLSWIHLSSQIKYEQKEFSRWWYLWLIKKTI